MSVLYVAIWRKETASEKGGLENDRSGGFRLRVNFLEPVIPVRQKTFYFLLWRESTST